MRLPSALVAVLAVCYAGADQLVMNPTGKRVPTGQARLRYSSEAGGRQTGRVDMGIFNQYELGVSRSQGGGTLVDLAYNLTLPYQDVTPGITLGVMDLAGAQERVGYVAVTFAYGNVLPHNQQTPTELTIGLWTSRKGIGFCGVLLPLTDRLRLVAEMGGPLPVAGAELNFGKVGWVRYTTDGKATTWSGSLAIRF